MDYKKSGVDIDAGNEAVRRIKSLVKSTFNPNVLLDIGSFGALFNFEKKKYEKPVLVASSDGVGTKVKVAAMANRHDIIGEDIVNHCIDDILTTGAKPLFFLDYIALNRMDPFVVEKIVEGMTRACREGNCALIGGETAEMGDVYSPGEYDVAGFIVGIVERDKIITGESIKEGDVLIGISSSGLHTNGYTLARKFFFEILKYEIDTYVSEVGETVGDALLKVHINYGKYLYDFIDEGIIKGIAHITGGGFEDNIPRVLPENTSVEIDLNSWDVPPLFEFMVEKLNLNKRESYRTFNMGIGMVIFVEENHKDKILEGLRNKGISCYVIGNVIPGKREVHYVG